VNDYSKRNQELRRLQQQELQRRTGEWHQELLALQDMQRGERTKLQQELASEDRRLRNRLLDLLRPGRQKTRHQRAESRLGSKQASERGQVHQRALQEREQIDARYARIREQIDRQERRHLESREAQRVQRAERERTDAEKRELFERYFPPPQQDRTRDRERDR